MSDPALMRNASNPKEVKAAKQKEVRTRDVELDDVRHLMASEAGRRLAWRLLAKARVFETTFHPSGSQTAFNEGMRNLGLLLLSDINEACPDAFLSMQSEARVLQRALKDHETVLAMERRLADDD